MANRSVITQITLPALAARTRTRLCTLAFSVLAIAVAMTLVSVGRGGPAYAQEEQQPLAATPPMGWSNWDAFAPQTVTEQDVRNNADRMVENGMQAAGYHYVIVGAGWQAMSRDENGEMTADPEKFPSGMKALADYVHNKGFKFGLQQAPGMTNCAAWPAPGTATAPGDTYADKARVDATTLAKWGVDFIRLDGCGYQKIRPADMTQLDWAKFVYGTWGKALRATGRDIVFWGNAGSYAHSEEWAPLGMNLWRIKGDLHPCWSQVLRGVDTDAPLADLAGPGHWNDPDFLVFGTPREFPTQACEQGLTDTEGRAQFSMWSILAAPLVASTNLTRDTATTLATLTNREVIAIDQDPLGVQGRRIRSDGDHEVWVKPLANGDRAVALFNRSETATTISATAKEIGMTRAAGYVMRDLWAHSDSVTAGDISAFVPAHGVAIYRVRPGTPDQAPPSATLSIDAPHTLLAGEQTKVAVTLTNNGRVALDDVHIDLGGPPGWLVQPLSGTSVDTLPPAGPGRSITTTWVVTPARDDPNGTYQLSSRATFTYGDDHTPAEVEAQDQVTYRAIPAVVILAPGAAFQTAASTPVTARLDRNDIDPAVSDIDFGLRVPERWTARQTSQDQSSATWQVTPPADADPDLVQEMSLAATVDYDWDARHWSSTDSEDGYLFPADQQLPDMVIDNDDPGVAYSGPWRTFAVADDVGNTHASGSEAGSTADIHFTGARAVFVGRPSPSNAHADFYLDGNYVATVDFYRDTAQYQQPMFDTGQIPAGDHTLTIVNTGIADPEATNHTITLDATFTWEQ